MQDVAEWGLVKPEIQHDLPSDTNQDMDPEGSVPVYRKKKIGKKSVKHLLESQGVKSTTNQYKLN